MLIKSPSVRCKYPSTYVGRTTYDDVILASIQNNSTAANSSTSDGRSVKNKRLVDFPIMEVLSFTSNVKLSAGGVELITEK